MKIKKLLGIMLFIVLLMFVACKDDKDEALKDIQNATKDLHSLMDDYYLWYNNLTELDYEQYDDIETAFYDMLYTPDKGGIDKWSYIVTYEEYMQLAEANEYIGIGLAFAYDINENFIVKMVYKNSPAEKAGLKRGDIINSINDIEVKDFENYTSTEIYGESKKGLIFKMNINNGDNIEIIEDVVSRTAVQETAYFDVDSEKVGYLLFDNFQGASTSSDLNNTFKEFKDNGVTKLILDLRYNGGGSLALAKQLAELIAGNQLSGSIFAKLLTNDKISNWSEDVYYETTDSNVYDNSLNLSELIVLTTKNSASASEAVINGLKPFIDVITIGDNTHGKAFGMYVLDTNNFFESFPQRYMLIPIMFHYVNSQNTFAGYTFSDANLSEIIEGFIPNSFVNDDFSANLADENEGMIKEALKYIKTGSFAVKRSGEEFRPVKYLENKGFRAEIGAY